MRSGVATLRSEFPRTNAALDGLFGLLNEAFEQHGVDQGTRFWVNLSAEEVFTNMVRHNRETGERIAVEVDVGADTVSVDLTDFGVEPFDPASAPKVDTSLPAERRSPGGLGVFIVHSKMDEVSYRHDEGNLTVSFTKNRNPAA